MPAASQKKPAAKAPVFTEAEADLMAKAIRRTWQAIGYDVCGESGTISRADLIEVCIDADRLDMYGSKEANALLRRAIDAHGYSKVFAALKKMAAGIY